jgi:hypothetical protein
MTRETLLGLADRVRAMPLSEARSRYRKGGALMDWQQKFAAIQAFAGNYDTSLMMRKPGDWYVSCGMSIGGDGPLTGSYGNGATPEDAVNEHWEVYSNLPFNRYAVNRENKRARWNGFMWEQISDEQAEAMRDRASAAK